MALDAITLSHFRNHRETRLDGARQFNLLVGENGAGKTNVLEAISLFAPGRGLRRAALAEMAGAAGPGGFSVGASLAGQPDEEALRLGTYTKSAQPGRRLVQVNGAPASAVGLGEWLAISWLTPAMDRLFADSAGARRRFMDRMALALDPAHARHAARYENALRERNRLLSDDRPPEAAWLDGIEAQMAQHGALLAQGRARTVAAVGQEIADLPEQPFARPVLVHAAGGPAEQDAFAAALKSGRGRDRAARRSLVGPHRDELEVTMAGKNVPAASCSTGEQKAMLIAITLAHAQLAARGRPGLLLLDEVAAHLDPVRRASLFERLRSGRAQVWLTGTELTPFAEIRAEAAVWQVSGGQVERV
ncbi:MAG: DNA replication/repair protein RecF [Allopontixanthobacter sediminis]